MNELLSDDGSRTILRPKDFGFGDAHHTDPGYWATALQQRAVMLSRVRLLDSDASWWIGIVRRPRFGEWNLVIVDDEEKQALLFKSSDLARLAVIKSRIILAYGVRSLSLRDENEIV